jgi:RimJ/RimL family protein N-acetyltransferase
VCIQNDEIAGFGLSRIDDRTVWIEWFGVKKGFRGHGLGTKIIEALEKATVQRNCHKIWCDSRTENKESISLLTKNGFRQIGVVENHWYRQDFILWEKLLI